MCFQELAVAEEFPGVCFESSKFLEDDDISQVACRDVGGHKCFFNCSRGNRPVTCLVINAAILKYGAVLVHPAGAHPGVMVTMFIAGVILQVASFHFHHWVEDADRHHHFASSSSASNASNMDGECDLGRVKHHEEFGLFKKMQQRSVEEAYRCAKRAGDTRRHIPVARMCSMDANVEIPDFMVDAVVVGGAVDPGVPWETFSLGALKSYY